MTAAVPRNGSKWIAWTAGGIAASVVVCVSAAWAMTCATKNELHDAHDRDITRVETRLMVIEADVKEILRRMPD